MSRQGAGNPIPYPLYGPGNSADFSFNNPGIHSFEVRFISNFGGGDDVIGIDHMTFGPVSSVSDVPEPSLPAFLVVSAVALGSLVVRHRRAL